MGSKYLGERRSLASKRGNLLPPAPRPPFHFLSQHCCIALHPALTGNRINLTGEIASTLTRKTESNSFGKPESPLKEETVSILINHILSKGYRGNLTPHTLCHLFCASAAAWFHTLNLETMGSKNARRILILTNSRQQSTGVRERGGEWIVCHQ